MFSSRSAVYAIYLSLLSAGPGGLATPVILQTALTLFVAFALIPPGVRTGPALAGLVPLTLLTPLPWVAAYAMPDILLGALVIYYAVLLRRIDAATAPQAGLLCLLAVFAAAAHYGNPPMAAVLAGLVLTWRAVTRRLGPGVVLLALLPVLLPHAATLAENTASRGTVSAAPARLPLLLARSLEDGPAARYLETACPEAGHAVCTLFEDEIPRDITAFLWAEDGLERASPALQAQIRDEEMAVLSATLRAYPMAQMRAFAENTLRQLARVGTDEALPRGPGGAPGPKDGAGAGIRALFDRILPVTTALAALALGALAVTARLPRALAEALALIVAALLLNAAVFGGLSAPVDRYGARLAWLLPGLLALALAWPPGRGTSRGGGA